ncbi:MAG: phage tail protein [Acidobacteria bacterium]|nr:phage tail protein [Acidobacteriota bacterium]
MADPFLGEIKMFGGNFAPLGYGLCNGQLLDIGQNSALFSLLGTIYGGDGQTTFALPDLRGRVPIHWSASYPIGTAAGTETVTLITTQIPAHSHSVSSTSNAATSSNPSGRVPAQSSLAPYSTTASGSTMGPQMAGTAGGNQPHQNMMPFLCLNFVIALVGIYPPRN